MRVEIDLARPLKENAAHYFAQSKKFKKKLVGLAAGVEALKKKAAAEKEQAAPLGHLARLKRERKWYEKYHWFFTSEGFLVLAGRDAQGNEAVVAKIMGEGDLYFHADIHGAAHTVLKVDGKAPGENSKKEAAGFAAVFSSAWREKIPAIDVYSALPGQVTKAAPSGEAIGKGAFMVYGKREWYKKTPLEFAIGCKKEGEGVEVFSGPPNAVRSRADFFVGVRFGNDSKGDAAKKIIGLFSSRLRVKGAFSHDEIVSLLPSGGIGVLKGNLK